MTRTRWTSGVAAALTAAATVAAFVLLNGNSEASSDANNPVSVRQAEILKTEPHLPEAYVAAVNATQTCLESAGLKSVSHSYDSVGKVSFAWAPFATREEAHRAGETYKQCYFEHMDDVDRLWQQSPEVEAAATERGWAVMRCIEAAKAGFRFSDDAAAVAQEVMRLEHAGDVDALSCVASAGTSMLKYTPLPR